MELNQVLLLKKHLKLSTILQNLPEYPLQFLPSIGELHLVEILLCRRSPPVPEPVGDPKSAMRPLVAGMTAVECLKVWMEKSFDRPACQVYRLKRALSPSIDIGSPAFSL